jgi:alcohol dehydrogenase class IV
LGALPDLKLHHGTLNAVVMPAVLRFNADHVGDKMDRLAVVMDLASGAEVIPALADLNRRLGIPAGLREMGVRDEWLPDLAEQAVADHCTPTNPRPAGVEDYIALFREAMG